MDDSFQRMKYYMYYKKTNRKSFVLISETFGFVSHQSLSKLIHLKNSSSPEIHKAYKLKALISCCCRTNGGRKTTRFTLIPEHSVKLRRNKYESGNDHDKFINKRQQKISKIWVEKQQWRNKKPGETGRGGDGRATGEIIRWWGTAAAGGMEGENTMDLWNINNKQKGKHWSKVNAQIKQRVNSETKQL